MSVKARIFHNPRCSKSRATLALLESRGVTLEVVDYLRTPPSRTTLTQLVAKLDVPALEIVRRDEPEYAARSLPADPTRDAIIDAICAEPKLLQRPIVEIGDRARIGRPPERVLELLE